MTRAQEHRVSKQARSRNRLFFDMQTFRFVSKTFACLHFTKSKMSNSVNSSSEGGCTYLQGCDVVLGGAQAKLKSVNPSKVPFGDISPRYNNLGRN